MTFSFFATVDEDRPNNNVHTYFTVGPSPWRHPCLSLSLLLGSETRSTAALLPIVRQQWALFFPCFTKPGVEWENTTEAGMEYLILFGPKLPGEFRIKYSTPASYRIKRAVEAYSGP